MDDGGEKEDWIKSLIATHDQLGRLSEQLKEKNDDDLFGIIDRISRTQSQLMAIKDWLSRQSK
jgi:hypothetical protein